jgi:hypothetical protein
MNKQLVPVAVAALLLAACGGKKEAAPPAGTNTPSSGGNPLTAPADYVGAAGNAMRNSAKTVDLIQVRQAIQQFHAAEDRFPKDLQELVKEGYLAKIPSLPPGMKLKYTASNGEVRTVATP